MELLEYYYKSLFHFLEIPKKADLCPVESSILEYCGIAISTLNLAIIIALILFILSAYKIRFFGKMVIFLPIFIFSSFYITDIALKIISKPQLYGLENFILYYASYCFFVILLFSVCILFRHFEKQSLILVLATTVISIFIMAYLGRGTYEHYKFMLGYTFEEFTIANFLESFSFKLILFLLFITIIYSLIDLAAEYIFLGHLHPKYFYLKYSSFVIYTIIITLTLLSLPIGRHYNDMDVNEAKVYIDDIKEQIEKYYYEYGEYPQIITDYLLEDENPRLLDRHEFFTMGIRGTYYFSRPGKFCFLFQNPSPEFGYYSITSQRGWRYTAATDSFDRLYINLCDETEESYESLMAGHLNLDGPDDELGKLLIDFNALDMPNKTNRASEVLHDRIMEQGKENPEIFKFYRAPERERKN